MKRKHDITAKCTAPAGMPPADPRTLELLAESALHFLDFTVGEDIYEFIAREFTRLAPVKAVSASEYLPEKDALVCRAIDGKKDLISRGFQAFNQQLIGREIKLSDEEARQTMLTGCAAYMEDGFYRLSFGLIPKPVCKTLEKIFGVGGLHAIGLVKSGELLGTMVFVPTYEGLNPYVVETFARQASGALHRIQAEQKRVALERQLNQSMRMESIGRLAGGIAHDFNNLLTAITGNVSMVIDDAAPDTPMHQALHEIQEASERAAALTRQLLTFSRRGMIRPRNVSLHGIIRQFSDIIGRLLGENINLTMDLQASEDMSINADPSQIEQVLLNLAVNARDAMPDGGELAISTREYRAEQSGDVPGQPALQPGRYVKLTVTDKGCGIDAITLKNIFEPFFTTKPKGKGTGLGLATVFGIVKQHNGAMDVDSAPGRGTSFHIFLPSIKADREREYEQPVSNSATPIPKGSENILLAEDEPTVRLATASVLRRFGYNVLEAHNGEHALELSRNFDGSIELLLTDVIMPGMNGRQLADKLVVERPDTAVLYASGYTEDVIGDKGVLDSSLHFIAKPFSISELAGKIRTVLDTPGNN